jgi:HEAT repeat protein
MGSASEALLFADPVQVTSVALVGTVAGLVCLLAFIVGRRALRARYFAVRDRRSQFIRERWPDILSGRMPAPEWFFNGLDRPIVEQIALDRIDVADGAERLELRELFRRSGLLDRRIREVRRLRGWRRRQSLLALSRMRAPESIAALAEALRDATGELAVEAVHALGQTGAPTAADAILARLARTPIVCPPQVLQEALISCYRSDAAALFPRVLEADDGLRPILARVLAEVADPRLGGDVGALAADPIAEVRAAAARLLAVTRPHHALLTLARLAGDKEWFVRLRAVVALGDLCDRRGIPVLVQGLCDSNRLVRLRAAASLVRFDGLEEQLLRLATRTRDRYALQALVSEMERAGLIGHLVEQLADDDRRLAVQPALVAAVRGGSIHMLVDLLLHHPDRRVRARLARVLAASAEPSLRELLEQTETLATTGQRRVLRWIIGRLPSPLAGRRGPESLAVAV